MSAKKEKQNIVSKEEKKKNIKEIILYIIFGALTTAVAFITLYLFELIIPDLGKVKLIGIQIDITLVIANILSWICAFIFAFVVNKKWVFNSKSWKLNIAGKELWQFFLARFGTGFIEWIGVPLLAGTILGQPLDLDFINVHIEGFWAKVVTCIIVIILNYVFSKFIIFKKDKNKEIEERLKEAEKAVNEKLKEVDR